VFSEREYGSTAVRSTNAGVPTDHGDIPVHLVDDTPGNGVERGPSLEKDIEIP